MLRRHVRGMCLDAIRALIARFSRAHEDSESKCGFGSSRSVIVASCVFLAFWLYS